MERVRDAAPKGPSAADNTTEAARVFPADPSRFSRSRGTIQKGTVKRQKWRIMQS